MIPPLPRPISLQPRILNWKHILEDPRLDHTLPEQLPAVPSSSPQLFTGMVHRLPLPLQLELVRAAPVRLVQLPRAVDGPVAQEPGATEAQRARRARVVQEVAD